jgi:putative ABC transport system permease protein
MALAMVLLCSSGLLAMSLFRLQSIPLGFTPGHVLTFPVALGSQRYRQAQRAPMLVDLTSRLKSIPGVVAVGAGGQLPLQGPVSRTVLSSVAGRPVQRSGIAFAAITPEYFRAVGISVRRGREFTEADTAAAPPVVILNEAAARKYFPRGEAVGQQVTPDMWNGSGSKTQERTVAGVVADLKLSELTEKPVPAIYWPVAQIPSDARFFVSVRTLGDPLRIARAVREQLHALDRDLPLYDVFPLDYYVDQRLALPRSTAVLVGGMALLALILTAVGLYGVIAYSVARRTREIGIRTALGASRGEILRSFLRSGLMAGILGAAIGLPGAIAAARLLRNLLFGVDAQKPLILCAGALTLILVAALASLIPARGATKVDPMTALRYE